jgi:DNA modification methylase
MKELLNKIHHADCLEFMKQLPDKSIDLVLTDPPYGIGYEYNSYKDTPENLEELVKNFVPEAIRIANRVAIFSGVQNVVKYPISDWLMAYTWNTTGNFGFYGYNQWQPVILYGKDVKGFGNINGVTKTDVLSFSGGKGVGFLREGNDKFHCCPKPLNVIRGFVNRLSEDGIVLDCFSGSGTTALACHDLGLDFICIEKDADYHKASVKRLEQHKRQLKLL